MNLYYQNYMKKKFFVSAAILLALLIWIGRLEANFDTQWMYAGNKFELKFLRNSVAVNRRNLLRQWILHISRVPLR